MAFFPENRSLGNHFSTKNSTMVSTVVLVRYWATSAQTPKPRQASKMPTIPESTVPKRVATKNLLKLISRWTFACWMVLMDARGSRRPITRMTLFSTGIR